MTKATIIGGASAAAQELVGELARRGEPLIWLGGTGGQAGGLASLGAPEDESAWTAAVAKAQAEHGGVARVLNLLANPDPHAVLETTSLAAFDAAVGATMVRSFVAMRATIPAMRDGGGGSFLTLWEQQEGGEAETLLEPVCLGGLELCHRVIAKEYAEAPTVNVNLVHCRSEEVSLEVLLFWSYYLGGDAGCYVTGANIGRPAH